MSRRSKKECNEHFSWEKLRRAELDMDRVRQWLKLDELLEKERQASRESFLFDSWNVIIIRLS